MADAVSNANILAVELPLTEGMGDARIMGSARHWTTYLDICIVSKPDGRMVRVAVEL